jgi:FMN-dependent NADH-azoreductase
MTGDRLRLLYVEASPMKAASSSSAVAAAFLEAYRAARPQDDIDAIDVWAVDLPPFDAEMIGAKAAVLRRQDATPSQRARWAEAVAVAQRFNAADRYLFSVPMWNFGIPYRLKHFIDVVTLPGENWSWSRETGYRALLGGKKAAVVYSSAGPYTLAPAEDPSDFQKPYLRRWLRFIGVESLEEINVAPTLVPPEERAAVLDAAMSRARDIGRTF